MFQHARIKFVVVAGTESSKPKHHLNPSHVSSHTTAEYKGAERGREEERKGGQSEGWYQNLTSTHIRRQSTRERKEKKRKDEEKKDGQSEGWYQNLTSPHIRRQSEDVVWKTRVDAVLRHQHHLRDLFTRHTPTDVLKTRRQWLDLRTDQRLQR